MYERLNFFSIIIWARFCLNTDLKSDVKYCPLNKVHSVKAKWRQAHGYIYTNTILSFDVICVMITHCNNTWRALVSRVTSFSIDSMLGEVIGLSAERGDFLAIDVSVEPFWAKWDCLCMTAYKEARPVQYIREIYPQWQWKRHFKNELAFFRLCRMYSSSLKISLELISWGLYSSLERERKFGRSLFTLSIKRESRHFHVVVLK